MAKPVLHPSHIKLPAETRQEMIALLNQHLADTFDLYSQVKQAHWNVKGGFFIALHLLFDDLAEKIEEGVDEIAERAAALGGVALGTARLAAASSRLPEFPHDVVEGMKCVGLLVDRYAALAESTRAAIDTADGVGDADTADLFTQLSRELDKGLWFLESHLHGHS